MSAGAAGLAFLAGLVSLLSPCVLPILPLVVGGAVASGRWSLVALAAGLAASFVAVGLFVATVGFSMGLDGDVLRAVAALMLAAFGVVLLVPGLQARFALATAGLGRAGAGLAGGVAPSGVGGHLLLGVLLGAAWSPCVGPTLGAASMLAAQGSDLVGVAVVMLAFGLGAALPLLLLGLASRKAVLRWRGRMAQAGRGGRVLIGAAAVAVAALILTGLDRRLEAAMVDASPAWLTELTTRY